MSKSNTRRIRKASFGWIVGHDDQNIELKFHGATKTGRSVSVTLQLEWWSLPYMLRGVREKWAEVKKQRLEQINRVDQVLPAPPPPF